MNYRESKKIAGRADRAEGKERKRLLEKLTVGLPELDPFEGHSEFAVMAARMLTRVKRFPYEEYS